MTDDQVIEAATLALDSDRFGRARSLLAPLVLRDHPAAVRINATFSEAGISDVDAEKHYVSGVQHAARLGDQTARYWLAIWYELGEHGFPEDAEVAANAYRDLAAEGFAHCQWIHATALLWGSSRWKQNVLEGLALLELAIQGGSAEAAMTMAKIHDEGAFGFVRSIQERDKYRAKAKQLADDNENYVRDPYDSTAPDA